MKLRSDLQKKIEGFLGAIACSSCSIWLWRAWTLGTLERYVRWHIWKPLVIQLELEACGVHTKSVLLIPLQYLSTIWNQHIPPPTLHVHEHHLNNIWTTWHTFAQLDHVYIVPNSNMMPSKIWSLQFIELAFCQDHDPNHATQWKQNKIKNTNIWWVH